MRGLFKGKKENPTEVSFKVYTSDTFEILILKKYIEAYLKESTKKEYQIQLENNQICVDLSITKDSKKNKLAYTRYQIIPDESSLLIASQKIKENTATSAQEITTRNLFDTKDKLIENILIYTNNTLDDGFFTEHQQHKMEFIATISLLEKNFLLRQLKSQEVCLLCLGITNLKSTLFAVQPKNDHYLIITSERNMILGSTGNLFVLHDITGHSLDLKEKIGKDTITSAQFSFDTELLNDTLFVHQKEVFNQEPQKRIEQYTDLLFDKYHSKESHLEYLKKLYRFQVVPENELKRTVKSMLLVQFKKKQCAKELVISQPCIDLLFTESAFGYTLFQIMKDWSIPFQEQYTFLELLEAQYDTFKLKNLDVFYDAVIAGMIHQEKAPKNILGYRVKHLSFLKETQQYDKAVPFYEFTLESLDDDSILELISDRKTNVLNGEDGHPLRIQLLEELSEIKRTLTQSNNKEVLEMATLQPMVLDRLTQLITSGIKEEKAKDILSLFMSEAFCSASDTDMNLDQKTYTKEELFDLVVPDCFKEAQSFVDSFTNMIAQVNPPDYGQVTTFSEKLSAYNHPEVYAILKQLAEQLQMDMPECYIGNGNFSKGIIGIEASPNFLILGKDHIQSGTPFYFTKNELTFNLALELTHILFKHTRLTSKDVWRGAKNKGMDLAGVLLVALPVVSTVGSFAGKFIDITKYTKVFTGVDTITNVVGKGQSAIEYGEKITEKFTSRKNESELLATSRLMEISADRVGLLVTQDLKSCIHVLLKNNDDYEASIQKINEEGLYTYLSQQDDKGEYIHQELIIRIKTLCSFYLQLD